MMIDFDDIDEWEPKLTNALRPLVPKSVKQTLIEAELEWIDDARDMLFDLTDRDSIICTVLDWLRSEEIACYHGSRLTDEEVQSIQSNGLIPLDPEARCDHLIGALSSHPRWQDVADRFNEVIKAYGQGNKAGHREGQAHLTLSRAGLIKGFNHYLIYGSEFDQHVAQKLLGADGLELLARYGKPRVFKVIVPGELALNAANRFFTVQEALDRGEIPNLAREFLKCWIHRLFNPSFQSETWKIDCGIVFHQTIPADWIKDCETLSDAQLQFPIAK